MLHAGFMLFFVAMMVFALGGPVSEVRATENAESVAGLYYGKTWASEGPYKLLGRYFYDIYLYLSPEGSFYEGYSFFGYDQINPTSGEKAGRYTVQKDEITLHYADGKTTSIARDGDNIAYSVVGPTIRMPNCDGFKLSGRYQLADLNFAVNFTPDGRFEDQGALPQILSNSPTPPPTLRPGSGTYTVKNHTLTLRYAHGPVFKLFFYVGWNDRGELDPSIIEIHSYRLSRVEQPSTPMARLPKIEAPGGWKSRYDQSGKGTDFTPLDLPKGREVHVLAVDPETLADKNVSRFPARFHDAVVRELSARYITQGLVPTKALTRQDVGTAPSSAGMFTLSDGKRLWMTIFTLLSLSQSQVIIFASDVEDLHNAYLPTVRAMLGDGNSTSTARLPKIEATVGLPRISVPSGWKIGRDGTNKNVTYVIPGDLTSGQEVRVLVADPERLPEGKVVVAYDRFHESIVQHSVKGMTAKGGRIAQPFASDTQGKTLSSTGLLTETNGKKFRMTMFTPMSSIEAQLVVYMAESDDLHRAYLPMVKAMLGEGDASVQAGMTSLETLLSKMRTNVNALNGWPSEYEPKEGGTQFTALNLPAGQFVTVVVEKREKFTSTLAQAHDESVRKSIANLEKENGRLEGTPKREERDGTVSTSLSVLLTNGMKIWGMSAATAVGDDMQEVSLITNNEDLYKQYLPTLKATLAEVAGG